jgi:hypothetical protein
MADMNPYVYALGAGIGSGIAFVGKYIFTFISGTIARESTRGDRLEDKLFETQAVIYPAVESATSAIREAIAAIAAIKEG